MIQYFRKPYDRFGENVKVELYLSNYANLSNLKGVTGVDTSNITVTGVNTSNIIAKSDLGSLKAEIDKIDTTKLKTVPIDLSKLSNVVNNEVVKNSMYDKLVAKLNAIDSSEFVLKSKYDTDKSDLENKINDADEKNAWC